MFRPFIPVLTLIFVSLTLGLCDLVAQAPLDDRQLNAAIRHGTGFKTQKKYLEKAAKESRCKWAGTMSSDGIQKHIVFLSSFDLVAGAAAQAQAEMRPFGLAEARALEIPDAVYAIVTMKAQGMIGRQKLHNRYAPGLHLVLESGGMRIQPIDKDIAVVGEVGHQATLYNWYTTGGMTFLTGLPLGAEQLQQSFVFPVSPWQVTNDVGVFAVDADGNRKELTCSMRGMRHNEARDDVEPPK
jgi:hypothetical protein